MNSEELAAALLGELRDALTRPEYLSDEDLAKLLDIPSDQVRARVRAGTLPGKEIKKGRTLTRRVDFDAWLACPQKKPERQPKASSPAISLSAARDT